MLWPQEAQIKPSHCPVFACAVTPCPWHGTALNHALQAGTSTGWALGHIALIR